MLAANGIDPMDLTHIQQVNCPELMADGIHIKIDPEFFSAEFSSRWNGRGWRSQKMIDGRIENENTDNYLYEEEDGTMWLP